MRFPMDKWYLKPVSSVIDFSDLGENYKRHHLFDCLRKNNYVMALCEANLIITEEGGYRLEEGIVVHSDYISEPFTKNFRVVHCGFQPQRFSKSYVFSSRDIAASCVLEHETTRHRFVAVQHSCLSWLVYVHINDYEQFMSNFDSCSSDDISEVLS